MDSEHYHTGTCRHGKLYNQGCAICECVYELRRIAKEKNIKVITCKALDRKKVNEIPKH